MSRHTFVHSPTALVKHLVSAFLFSALSVSIANAQTKTVTTTTATPVATAPAATPVAATTDVVIEPITAVKSSSKITPFEDGRNTFQLDNSKKSG